MDYKEDSRIIEVKLEALTDLVRMGFNKIDLRFDRFDDRMRKLEDDVGQLREFRASVEAREQETNVDWTKIVLGLISVLGVALAILSQVLVG